MTLILNSQHNSLPLPAVPVADPEFLRGGGSEATTRGWALTYYYRPQRSRGKVMFLHVSVILFTGGGPEAGTPSLWEQTTPLQAAPPGAETPQQTPTPREQTPPQRSVCWKIRAISGRYASYWNAILFDIFFHQNCMKMRN